MQTNRSRRTTTAALGAVAVTLCAAVAHAAGASLQQRWTFQPWVAVCLAASGGLYVVGLARLWRRAGRVHGVRAWQVGVFAAGWLAILAALSSPLDALADTLFSAHMMEHELLMTIAAPLLVLGRPLAVWVWAFPPAWRGALGGFFRRRAWRVPWDAITSPISAWALHALTLWLWHLPVLFEAALASEALHALQHVMFLGTALLFWWSVLGATRRERGVALLSLFTTMVHTGALGALLTLSRAAWYPSYAAGASLHGLTALEDQQLGGIVMWVPTGLVYIACALMLAGRWIAQPARR